MMSASKESGVSVIELIVVILILAILVVAAAPKFLDVSDDALTSTRATIVSSFQNSINNVRLKWVLSGRPAASSNNNGARVELNEETFVVIDDNYGYPVGSRGRDRVNSFNVRDCEEVFNDLMDHSLTLARRGQVNNSTLQNFDLIVSRENASPDICHYTWSSTIDSRPANRAPSAGVGFSYNPVTGKVTSFDFT